MRVLSTLTQCFLLFFILTVVSFAQAPAPGIESISASKILQDFERLGLGSNEEVADLGGSAEGISFDFDIRSGVGRPELRVADSLSDDSKSRLPDTVLSKLEELIVPSEAVSCNYVAPAYPRRALVMGLSGAVDLLFDVNTQGRAQNVRVIGSYAGSQSDLSDAHESRMFVGSAKSAVERWTCESPQFEVKNIWRRLTYIVD